MNQSSDTSYSSRTLRYYLKRSSLLHVLLILLAVAGGKMAIESSKLLQQKNLKLVQASVRVDMVSMPKYTLNELKNVSSGVEEPKKEEPTPTTEQKVSEEPLPAPKQEVVAPEPKEVAKEDSAVFEQEAKIKRSEFLSKLKQIGSKKIDSEGNQKAERGLNGAKRSELKQLVLAGNKLSKGVSIYGDNRGGDLSAFQAYAAKLPEFIRPHWRLPSFLIDKNLRCSIRIWIAPNGDVVRAEIYETSGDKEYDQRALEAIKAASPLPRQSEEFASRGSSGDILLGFPL